jgi:hypothetical protein
MTCGNKKIFWPFRLPGQRDSARDPEKACPGLDPIGANLSNPSAVMPAKAGIQ